MPRRFSTLMPILLLAAISALAQPALAAGDDPIVARVDGRELHRSDIEAAQRSLPPQYQQVPLQQIYPALLEQMVGGVLFAEAGRKEKLADDPEVKQRMAHLEDQVISNVYVTRQVDKAETDDALKARYQAFLKTHPPKEEVHARHILVATEAEAKAIIAELDKGADFATLAKERSTDPAKDSGGDLGFFSRDEMVPEFADAAFKLKKGEYTKTPVHTQFGWHIIKVEDRREAAPPSFDEAKPELKQEMAHDIVAAKLKELRAKAKVETFALDGSKLPAKP